MLIIDRFEYEIAIVEGDREIIEIPKHHLPAEAKEGDVIKIIIDEQKTEERRQQIEELSAKLFE